MTAASHPLRLAYLTPLPPSRSGIADYSAELLPALAGVCSPVVFTADPAEVAPALQQQFAIRPLPAYASQRWQFDAALYQMGNSRHHQSFYELMRRYPGILVLHDYVLHHFIADQTVGRQNFSAYLRELGYALGTDGIAEAWAIQRGEAGNRLNALPLNNRALDLSLGAIVHSRYVQQKIAAQQAAYPAHVVPAPVAQIRGRSRRQQLPWEPAALILASFGQMTAAKQPQRALRAFARLRQKAPHAHYLLVGQPHSDVNLEQVATDLELGQSLYLTGYVEGLQTFVDWLSTVDVVLNLRYPTLGETSAAALRAMAAGRAVVVYDHGWYAELPDDVVVKVPPLDDEALLVALEKLARDTAYRQSVGRNAEAYIAEKHTPAAAARAYVAAIKQILPEITARGSHA